MNDLLERLERPAPRPPRRLSGPFRSGAAGMMLIFGALFGRISHFFNAVAQLWLGDWELYALRRAFSSFHAANAERGRPPLWELRFMRVGVPVAMGIGGALIGLSLLILLGGALAWLALKGYVLFLLFGAVVVGAVLGARRARLSRRLPPQSNQN